MARKVRLTRSDDIEQITAIDREAFATMWPPVNFQRELKNKLAHYLVVYDDESMHYPIRKQRKKAASCGWFNRCWKRLIGKNISASVSPQDIAGEPAPVPRILGFAGFWLIRDEAHIMNIAVREGYRGRGTGKLLLISLLDLARELGADMVTLEVRASNTLAQHLYERFEFVKMGVRRGYYSDNKEDAIIMTTENLKSDSFQENLSRLRNECCQANGKESLKIER